MAKMTVFPKLSYKLYALAIKISSGSFCLFSLVFVELDKQIKKILYGNVKV